MTKDEALKVEPVGLIDRLTNPEQHYEFTDPKKANAVLMSLCQEAADALAAPVQEPIGYLFQHEETGLTMVVDVQQVEWGFEKNNPRHQKIGPVYTTPPAAQRQWVGLTDEEVNKIVEAHTTDDHGYDIWCDGRSAARAIEAKLKEKNT